MKKLLLALSILSSFAGSAAWAQTTFYGLVDAGVNFEAPNASSPLTPGNRLALQSGLATPSHIGFTGSENLMGNLKALFKLEAGVLINNGQNSEPGVLFNRASWLGLSGDFGSVRVGRQYTPMYDAVYALDPFELGMAGNAANLMQLGGANSSGATLVGGNNPMLGNGGGSALQNNSLRYVSHSWRHFSVEANYGIGGQAGSASEGAETGMAVNYENGPLMLVAAYDSTHALSSSDVLRSTLVGGNMKWSGYGVPLTTSMGYQINQGTDLTGSVGGEVDAASWLLGLRAPFGPHEVLFSYLRFADHTSLGYEANQFALGYTYALSKRTTLYSSVGRVINKNGADFTLGNASNAGYGVKALDLGIRHAF
jgi:predicted porin